MTSSTLKEWENEFENLPTLVKKFMFNNDFELFEMFKCIEFSLGKKLKGSNNVAEPGVNETYLLYSRVCQCLRENFEKQLREKLGLDNNSTNPFQAAIQPPYVPQNRVTASY